MGISIIAVIAAEMKNQIGRDAALRMVINLKGDLRLYRLACQLSAGSK